MRTVHRFTLAAGLLALAFTLSSCLIDISGNDDDLSSSSNRANPSSSSIKVVNNPSSSSAKSGISSSSKGTVTIINGTITYEGQTYKVVTIGTQTWMAENLNYNVEGSKCYNNNSYNCEGYGEGYGRLYDWITALVLPYDCISKTCSYQISAKHRGICPQGWHIPSQAEWNKLTTYIGGSSTEGKHLKATYGWDKCGASGSGSPYSCEDTYGFAALPGGFSVAGAGFYNAGNMGYWWSTSEYYDEYSDIQLDANVKIMGKDGEEAIWISGSKYNMYSIRCVQD